MRSSIARRPIASPCLLCLQRAAATAERSIPRVGPRRRFNRRVHSSANRLAGENLASRPEPEDDRHYGIPSATPSFSGFGTGRTASIAASKWGKKPKVVEPPPPPPPPVQETSYIEAQNHTISTIPEQNADGTQARLGQDTASSLYFDNEMNGVPLTSDSLAEFTKGLSTTAASTRSRQTETVEADIRNVESIQSTLPEMDQAQAAQAAQVETSGLSKIVSYTEAHTSSEVEVALNTDSPASVAETASVPEPEASAASIPQFQEDIQTPIVSAETTQIEVLGDQPPEPQSSGDVQLNESPAPIDVAAEVPEAQAIPPTEQDISAATADPTEPTSVLETTAPIDAAAGVHDSQLQPTPEAQSLDVSASEVQSASAVSQEAQLPEDPGVKAQSPKKTPLSSTSSKDVSTSRSFGSQDLPASIQPESILASRPQIISSQATSSTPIAQPLSFLDRSAAPSAPTTFKPKRPTGHASTGLSWAERELGKSELGQASDTPRAAPTIPQPAGSKWARPSALRSAAGGSVFSRGAEPPAPPPKADYDLDYSSKDFRSMRAQYLQGLDQPGSSAPKPESLTRNQEIKNKWLKSWQAEAPAAIPSTPVAAAAKWGIKSRKSVFAAADSNDILDQLSGRASTAQPTPSARRERDTFGEDSLTAEQKFNRSFQEFQTTDKQYDFTPRKDDFARRDLVEEAFAEAGIVEEDVLGSKSGKKSKKERRRQAELEAKAKVTESEEWNRKASAKEKDKAKHSRQWVTEDEDFEAAESKAEIRERKRLERERKAQEKLEQEQRLPPILIPEFVSVSSLARLCKVKLERFTFKMEQLGFTETAPDHVLNAEMAGLIAMEYGFEPVVDKSHERDLIALPVPADKSHLPPRPPVVTIMGHVDHGKTTILDWLRKSSIVDQEHGGITQHIGAFSVNMPSGRIITFLDTPGHEAFLKMRERGANMTDIVILVVAADDSIMPQTIEAIKHAKAANVPIIVAINKCDKEDAEPERVKRDLAQYDIQIEEVGGDTQVVCVSGKTGLGMEDLEEAVLLQADDIDMRADKTGRMEGWVVEASTKAKGRVATVLVRRGTLKKGDVLVAGTTWARVRNIITDTGVELEEALPGTPVEVDGWRDQPDAGDEILQAVTEDKAKSVVDYRMFKIERQQLAKDIEAINESRRLHHEKKEREARLKELQEQGLDAEEAAAQVGEPQKEDKFKIQEVPFIIKADVAGSVEAVEAQVLSVANEEIRTMVLKTGVGPLTESDVRMAESTGAYCLTFNVNNDPDIMALARYTNVKTIHHTVIYAILDDIKTLMSEKLKPIIVKTVAGEAEILKVFQYNVKKKIMRPFAGCKVYRGTITKNSKAKIVRNGETVYDGSIETLKYMKKEMKEMSQGSECGIGFMDFDDFQEGDIVHCYTEVRKKRTFN